MERIIIVQEWKKEDDAFISLRSTPLEYFLILKLIKIDS